MSDYYVGLVYLVLFAAGFVQPFAFTLGYVWVDAFYPQFLSTLLTGLPVAMVMGVAAVGGYLLYDRQAAPKVNPVTILTVAMAVWVTLTCLWAVAPSEVAWAKWNWAFKTVIFSAFIPYVIRTRIRIEAYIQVFVLSVMIHLVPVGVKTLINGGGYSLAMTVVRGNSGFFESSTLATVAVMVVPLLMSLRRHSLLLPWPRLRILIYGGYVVFSLLAAVGGYTRTALVGAGILAVVTLVQIRRKVIYSIVLILIVLGVVTFSSDAWQNRMGTIETYREDASAWGRVMVWQWTLEFAATHPLGGGFNSYYTNGEIFAGPNGEFNPGADLRKAFHSAYFEMLGEHGWVGLGMFGLLIIFSIRNLWWVVRRSRLAPDLQWCKDMAAATLSSMVVLMGCAAFIGIAFQPMFWYLFAISTCLQQHVLRSITTAVVPQWMPQTGAGVPNAVGRPVVSAPEAAR